MKLVIGTSNPGKVSELRELFACCGVELVTPKDLGLDIKVVEDGGSYIENARLKAEAFARAAGMPALADDSGLEVDALGGAPGVDSARYAGDDASDADRVALLLRNMQGVPAERRTARFRCVIAVAAPGDGKMGVAFFEGACEGIIGIAPKGEQGFGYDPVFYFFELKKTMAELSSEVKNRISHRGRAAALACEYLKNLAER